MYKLLIILFFSMFSALSFSQNEVVVPNVFTPDGDGVNDVFEVKPQGYNTLKCTIFNRHGGVVYQYQGLNGSWDGWTHAGVKCVPGTYFVLLELGIEGGENVTFQGDLQLIRPKD